MEKNDSIQKNPLIKIKKNSFEYAHWQEQSVVCGIDEVGRGCLAGPVVAAAAILPINTRYRLLKDSKILSETERLQAFQWIKKNGIYGIGIVHNRAIDEHNIRQATLQAMKKAFMQLMATSRLKPGIILVDAMPLKLNNTAFTSIPVAHFPKGESKSSSIAAASIVAKVFRDSLMHQFDTAFPHYQLARHKGYGTKSHHDALYKNKHSIIHRLSFLKNITHIQEFHHEKQQCLC